LKRCRECGFPPVWVERFAAESPPLSDPWAAVKAFEAWCVDRLAACWAGGESQDEDGVGGQLAAYLVQRYLADSARVLAYRYRLSDEEWEDIVAAAAERSLRVFAERPIESPQAYLFKATQRAVWEYLRKARREVASAEMPVSWDGAPSPEEHAHWRRLMAAFLEHCYDRISERDQQILEGLEIEGHSAAEVGTQHGMTANAVNVRKHRARKRLLQCMNEQTGADGAL